MLWKCCEKPSFSQRGPLGAAISRVQTQGTRLKGPEHPWTNARMFRKAGDWQFVVDVVKCCEIQWLCDCCCEMLWNRTECLFHDTFTTFHNNSQHCSWSVTFHNISQHFTTSCSPLAFQNTQAFAWRCPSGRDRARTGPGGNADRSRPHNPPRNGLSPPPGERLERSFWVSWRRSLVLGR